MCLWLRGKKCSRNKAFIPSNGWVFTRVASSWRWTHHTHVFELPVQPKRFVSSRLSCIVIVDWDKPVFDHRQSHNRTKLFGFFFRLCYRLSVLFFRQVQVQFERVKTLGSSTKEITNCCSVIVAHQPHSPIDNIPTSMQISIWQRLMQPYFWNFLLFQVAWFRRSPGTNGFLCVGRIKSRKTLH